MRAGVSVVNVYWGFSYGGISQYVTEIESVRSFSDIKLKNLCIISSENYKNNKALGNLSELTVLSRNGWYDLRWVVGVLIYIKDNKPDLIFTHAFNGHFVALLIKLLCRQPPNFIASYHGRYHAPSKLKQLLVGPYNWFNDKYLSRVPERIVTVAGCGKGYLISKGISAEKIEVIHNGIPDVMSIIPNKLLRRDIGITGDALVIGVISRFEPIKGLPYLFNAFQHLVGDYPGLYLVLIGSGTQEEYLRKLAYELGFADRVIFVGYRSDAAKYLPIMDIFALPSLSEFHSIGLLEAMRASRAIVATEVGGNTESITDGIDGLIVPSSDVDALEMACRILLDSSALRGSLGKKARQRYLKEFTIEVMLNNTVDFLKKAAQE